MINKLEEWFNHLTIPRRELSNTPICPFAKIAITNREYTIEETNLESITLQISNTNVQVYKVCIFYLPNYEIYEVEALEAKTKILNHNFRHNNVVVLDSDPRNPFVINGITTTFPDCYLWIVQDLADLTSKSNNLKLTDYYKHWTQKQIDEVVTWRTTQQD